MTVEFIFVYGTLRKVSGTVMSEVLARHSVYVSEATIQGVLYEVDAYPAVIESMNAEEIVHGEVHKMLDDTLLPLLDEYEECTEPFPLPHEYVRKILPVTLTDGDSVMAWVYIYNRDVTLLQRLNHRYRQ